MQPEPTIASLPTDDEGLVCLECEYNLSGLTKNRCPECGKEFDRAHLRLLRSGDPMPVHPWDERGELSRPSAFWQTCRATWLRPRKFARAFPAGHCERSAWAFSVVCYGLAALLFFLPTRFRGFFAESVLIAFVCVPVSAICCEEALATAFALLVRPRNVPPDRRRHFWRGLMHYTGNFLLLSSLAAAMAQLLSALFATFGRGLAFSPFGWLFALSAVLYWWWGVAHVVEARARRRTTGLIVAWILIPVVGIVSYFVCSLSIMWFYQSL